MALWKRQANRTEILVDRELQVNFAVRLAGQAFFFFILFLTLASVTPAAIAYVFDSQDPFLTASLFRADLLVRVVLVPLLLTGISMYLFGIRESFRFAGPHCRFNQVFKDLQNLRVPRGIQIRKRDHFQDSATEFNKALLVLNETFLDLRRKTEHGLDSLKSSDSPERGDKATDALKSIAEVLRSVELVGCAPDYEPMDSSVRTRGSLRTTTHDTKEE